jgi:hypothetical protein
VTWSGWDARKYPRNPTAYVMKNTNGDVIEHMDGMDVVFAYYNPSMTGATPSQPPKRKESVPHPTVVKPIMLKVIEMTTGDVTTLPNIAHYNEAFSAAKTLASIPEDWTVTIIENKTTQIMVACAPPTYGSITPEKYNALRQRQTTELSATPKPRAIPRAVMVVLTYMHLTSRRKTIRTTRHLRVEEDDSKQELLNHWIIQAREDGKDSWPKIARKMSMKEADYEWFTGTEDPLQFPWYDCEAVAFRDPARSSTGPVIDDDEPEATLIFSRFALEP